MTDIEIRQAAELSLPMRSLEESTRIIRESYQKEGELAQAYLDELVQSGRELAGVKAHDTYGEGDYANFDEYCRVALPFSQHVARSRILFYEITKAARERRAGEPTSLRQMQALRSAVPGTTEDRVNHWLTIASDGVEVTTKSIQGSVDAPIDSKTTLTFTTPDGEILEADSPEELARKIGEHITNNFAGDTPAIEAPEKTKVWGKEYTLEELAAKIKEVNADKNREKAAKEGAEQAEKNLQAQIDERIEKANAAFLEELTRVKAKYGDFEPPEFGDIDPEAWVQMAKGAQDVRVKEAGQIIRKVMDFPQQMGEYMPGEAAQAALNMSQDSGKIAMALEFVQRWISGVVEEMENEDSLAHQRIRS